MNFARMFGTAMLIASVGACSAVPTAPSQQAAAGIEGCWQGRGAQPAWQGQTSWLAQHKSDGSFEIEFRNSKQPTQRESGRWKRSGDTFTIVTSRINGEPVDPRDPSFTDVYLLMEVTSDSMTYRHQQANIVFHMTRVPCPGDV